MQLIQIFPYYKYTCFLLLLQNFKPAELAILPHFLVCKVGCFSLLMSARLLSLEVWQLMGKPKQRLRATTPASKNITPSGPEVGINEEYGWVVVKKQKVTILIPPLPEPQKSAMPEPGESQPQAMPRKAATAQSPCSIRARIRRSSVSDGQNSVSLTPEKSIPYDKKFLPSQPISNLPKLSRADGLHNRMRLENCGIVNPRCHGTPYVRGSSKLSKKSKSFRDGNLLLNKSLKASNLERKLQRAGGLSRWLASLGLDQFVKRFEGKSVTKFQLVSLTMKKLKDMGVNAVGPRRKLIHAIDCLCQPYCFEAL